MKRRGFLTALVAVTVVPFVPRRKYEWRTYTVSIVEVPERQHGPIYRCTVCGEMTRGGDLVVEQGGPHSRCAALVRPRVWRTLVPRG